MFIDAVNVSILLNFVIRIESINEKIRIVI